MSRWSNWSRGTKPGLSLQDFLSEGPVDQLRSGNPTGTGQVSPADRARQLGLKSNGKGGYIDPKSGQVVARTVNNELIFYSGGPTGGAISDGSGGATLANPASSWQDPTTGLMVTPPGKPESPGEIASVPDPVPAVAPAGYNDFIQKQKMQAYEQDSINRQHAIFNQQQPNVGNAPEQQPEPMDGGGMPEMQTQDPMVAAENYLPGDLLGRTGGLGPPSFAALRDRMKAGYDRNVKSGMIPRSSQITPEQPKITQVAPQQEEEPQSPSFNDIESRARNAYSKWQTAKIDTERRMNNNYGPIREALQAESLSPSTRNRALHVLGDIYDYEGRDNEKSSDLTKSQYHALKRNKQRLLEAYGGAGSDGSTPNMESVASFVRDISSGEINDELLETIYNNLPPAQKKVFTGGTYSSGLNGFKQFFRQQGRSAYTGLPLSLDAMDMEHFIDSAQAQSILSEYGSVDNMPPDKKELYEFILSDANQFWEDQAPNQQKSASTMADFYKNNVDIYDDYGDDFFDFREFNINPARLKLKGQEKDYIRQHLIDSSDPENPALAKLSPEDFDNHMQAISDLYQSEKNAISDAISERFDPKGLIKLSDKQFQKMAMSPNSDITDEDAARHQMLRTLQTKYKNLNSDSERRLLSALGIPTGMTMTQRSRSTSMSNDAYKAITQMIRDTPTEERADRIAGIKKILKTANSVANKAKGPGGDDVVRDAMYNSLINSGIFDEVDTSKFKKIEKLISKYRQKSESMDEPIDMIDDEEIGIEEVMELVKMLMGLENKDLTYEQFRLK